MSLLSHLYYDLKPYLPASARLAVRRVFARQIRRKSRHIWPIDESAARPPKNWKGWPNGKQFALVLTHDVEGPSGLANCRKLMELEASLGFRSSFNFIPEGSYSVPDELRADLGGGGFEVGVHDLRHDGKLYRSHHQFLKDAQRINKYLRAWNAVGFRSGFMHRKLGWLHDLEIQYDMSTFDTDPFEPQPDGVGTIFPFWVPRPQSSALGPLSSDSRPQSSGYLELPYTLPQDSTLFGVLEERTIDLWKTKLDWIARRGGMALLNVHPDYIAFDENSESSRYPVAFYQEFLRYVTSKYGSEVWHALPNTTVNTVFQNRSNGFFSQTSQMIPSM